MRPPTYRPHPLDDEERDPLAEYADDMGYHSEEELERMSEPATVNDPTAAQVHAHDALAKLKQERSAVPDAALRRSAQV